ncbi:NUDIX hydrolase [Cryptosporangium aurantiacum]|uniref:ADP-ribose pyrophosphatase YjhB, NUDIX family n=1 Tax=Cryptosporangium aurantiacum TaxID=134849 RepID=A0A1M7RK58_9ACTN|nr:NUDIX domain-containing protein [Cryptosporangium aurantiacum]SHN46458.1 ADP-ribose pyrophosphatase YjhB, NUDIX family [Cryptosporangium aurantiacum]
MTTPRHSVSVAAAIVDDRDRVLVIQRRDNGKWQPPGGILELDESITEGLAREVREETGLEIRAERLSGVYKNLNLGVVALVFRAARVSGTETLSDETAAIDWWDAKTIRERSDPAFAIRLLDALNSDTAPAVRSHDGMRLIDR